MKLKMLLPTSTKYRNLSEQPFDKDTYEFHLSTEPDLKEGVPFSKQIRTASSSGERGDMGAAGDDVIYTTDSPEDWYEQFQMELGLDAPDAIPKYLYIVKVRNKSLGGYLSQAVNRPEDVIVVRKIQTTTDAPNFNLGYQLKRKLDSTHF